MVIYNPKDWFKLIFQFHKSDTFRMLLPALIGMSVMSALIVFIFEDWLQLKFKSTIAVHSLVGFVMSLLLVFRTNTAYDRWWEGRKLWGSFVNNSRNLALKLSSLIPEEEVALRRKLRVLIANYVFAAKEHLRGSVKPEDWEQCPELDNAYFQKQAHVPNALAAELHREIFALRRNRIISDVELLTINDELRSFTDNLGACERIRSTPIPYSYSLFIKKIIFVYTLSMPFGFLADFRYWTVAIVALVFYAFASLEIIAEEIEDPFGNDANDLATDDISVRISSNLRSIFGEPANEQLN